MSGNTKFDFGNDTLFFPELLTVLQSSSVEGECSVVMEICLLMCKCRYDFIHCTFRILR